MLSPVSIDSSTAQAPSNTRPSTGTVRRAGYHHVVLGDLVDVKLYYFRRRVPPAQFWVAAACGRRMAPEVWGDLAMFSGYLPNADEISRTHST